MLIHSGRFFSSFAPFSHLSPGHVLPHHPPPRSLPMPRHPPPHTLLLPHPPPFPSHPPTIPQPSPYHHVTCAAATTQHQQKNQQRVALLALLLVCPDGIINESPFIRLPLYFFPIIQVAPKVKHSLRAFAAWGVLLSFSLFLRFFLCHRCNF